MLHPSYTDLMQVVNKEVEEGDSPVVNSRYSIVLATSKRARQIIDGCNPLVDSTKAVKPLSIAVAELDSGKVKILSGVENTEDDSVETEDTEAEEITAEAGAEETDSETEEIEAKEESEEA